LGLVHEKANPPRGEGAKPTDLLHRRWPAHRTEGTLVQMALFLVFAVDLVAT
jgi:hypothetical protein